MSDYDGAPEPHLQATFLGDFESVFDRRNDRPPSAGPGVESGVDPTLRAPLELAALRDHDGELGLGVCAGRDVLDLVDDHHGGRVEDLAEDDLGNTGVASRGVGAYFRDSGWPRVFSVEPVAFAAGDEELGAVRVRAGVGHREEARAGVAEVKVLVRERLSVDRDAPRAVALEDVAALDHELLDHSVERRLQVARLGTREPPSTGRGSARDAEGAPVASRA